MRLNPARLKTMRILLSVTLSAIVLIFVTLSIMSAANFTDIVYAKLSASANADVDIAVSGLGPSGEMMDTSVVMFSTTVNITNPSSKTIRLQFVKYQCWVRNYWMEDLSNSSSKIFYSALVRNASYRGDEGLVEPRGARSFPVSWQFDKTELVRFQETRRIVNYALMNLSPPISWDQVEWNHFFVFQLIVSGVPSDYHGPSSGYLIELPVIWRYQGVSLGSG